jgi:hypothetical protein
MDLEQRIARLEAIEAIKKLKATYAEACDDDYNPQRMFPLFCADAVWEEATTFGRHEGRDAICAFFAGVSAPISWALHYTDAPLVTVADDLGTATSDWYIFMPATVDGGPLWLMATYSDRYRIEDGVWKFAHVSITIERLTPFADGWVKTPHVGA